MDAEKGCLSRYTQLFMPLLDRGFILAFTQERDTWVEQSVCHQYSSVKEMIKQRTVGDFIDCVQHLIREKNTCASKLATLVSQSCTLIAYAELSCELFWFVAQIISQMFL